MPAAGAAACADCGTVGKAIALVRPAQNSALPLLDRARVACGAVGPQDSDRGAQNLSSALLRRWIGLSLLRLEQHREVLDRLNVFPVPDSDTGTNVLLTFRAAAAAVTDLEPDTPISTVSLAFARAALLGARGNSGVILSQQLRGLATAGIPSGTPIEAAMLARAMTAMAAAGRAAVHEPREGTMLSVARDAAHAASAAAEQGSDIRGVARAARDAARDSVARTQQELSELSRAGVVDAGGAAIALILDALDEALSGQASPRSPWLEPNAVRVGANAPYRGPSHEVMYLLQADDQAVTDLRGVLAELGESLMVVGGDGLWNVHVHVDDTDAAIAAGMARGSVQRIRVVDLASAGVVDTPASRTLIAVSPDAPTRAVLSNLSISATGAEELLTEVLASCSAELLLLSCGSVDIHDVVSALRREGRRVAIVACPTAAHAVAAVAVYDATRDVAEVCRDMTEAVAGTRVREIDPLNAAMELNALFADQAFEVVTAVGTATLEQAIRDWAADRVEVVFVASDSLSLIAVD